MVLGAEQGTCCGKRRLGQRALRGPETNGSDSSAMKMSHAKAVGQSHLDSGVQDLLIAQLSMGHPLHAFQGPGPDTHLAVSGELQRLLRFTKMGEMLHCAGQKAAGDKPTAKALTLRS